MNDLQPILLVLLAGALIAAIYLWRRLSALEIDLRKQRDLVEDKRAEVEKVRQEGRDRVTELEQTKKHLHETKAKLKRQQPKDVSSGSKKQRGADESIAGSAATTVRIGHQALEEEHRASLARLEGELQKANAEVARLKAAELKRKEDAERAAKVLAAQPAPAQAVAPAAAAAAAEETAAARTPEERIAALETQLEAFQRAAREKQRAVEKALGQAEGRASAANKRASSNHALYQVIKGQLELTEDKLALFRRKYEGAKTPAELKPRTRAPEAAAAQAAEPPEAVAEPEGAAPEAAAQAAADSQGDAAAQKAAAAQRAAAAPPAEPAQAAAAARGEAAAKEAAPAQAAEPAHAAAPGEAAAKKAAPAPPAASAQAAAASQSGTPEMPSASTLPGPAEEPAAEGDSADSTEERSKAGVSG